MVLKCKSGKAVKPAWPREMVRNGKPVMSKIDANGKTGKTDKRAKMVISVKW